MNDAVALPTRVVAATLDTAVVSAPLLVGWLLVRALPDAGQADRAFFAALAIVIAAALFYWNFGLREGRTGQSVGKSLTSIVARDVQSGDPTGSRRALRRRLPHTAEKFRTEFVTAQAARDAGFAPLARDDSPAAVRRRLLVGLAALAVLIAAAVIASLAVGAQPLTIGEIHHALVEPSGTVADGIVRSLRAPRTALALVAGAALGVAGALIQGYTRNPLADAGLLGLNAGAAFLVVVAIHAFALATPSQYIWFAFAGAFAASVVVFGVASIGGGAASPLSLALSGAAVSFFLQAMTNAVVLLDAVTLDSFRFWVVGSVAGRGADVFWQVSPFLAAGFVIAVAASPALNVLSLGDDVARSLGTDLGRARLVGIVAITLLCGAATAACGPIAFVGLIVPHLARSVTGPDFRWLVPYSALLGALLVTFADTVGRIVARPGEVQVGIVLALIGAPFFIALVRRRKLVSL